MASITNEIKAIIEGYINNQKLPAILIGTYNGSGVVVSDRFTIPAAQVSGNFKKVLKSGDKVRLVAGTGWKEFYVLEIINRTIAFKDEIKEEALK